MTNLELYYEHNACNIYFNKDLHVVHTQWKGPFVQGEVLRTILNNIITLLKAKRTNAVLSDARKMKVITEEDQQWIINDWYPRALAEGFYIEALMVTKGTFNEHTLQQIVKRYDAEVIVTRFFTKYNEAAEWLKVYTVWKEWS